jgi:hypothetical protein
MKKQTLGTLAAVAIGASLTFGALAYHPVSNQTTVKSMPYTPTYTVVNDYYKFDGAVMIPAGTPLTMANNDQYVPMPNSIDTWEWIVDYPDDFWLDKDVVENDPTNFAPITQ